MRSLDDERFHTPPQGAFYSFSVGNPSLRRQESPWAHVLTPEVVPANEQRLTILLGLNFIGLFDFQFEFDQGRAAYVTFFPR